MKFYSFLIIQLLVVSIFAQTEIELELISNTQLEGQDLSNEFLDIPIYINVTNTGEETASLKWEFVALDGNQCVEPWDMLVCDNNNCYTPQITSNIDPDIGLDIPSIIEVGETIDFIFHVKPKSVEGCCEVGIYFSSTEDQETIIASIDLPISINDPNCENAASAISDLLDATSFSVYSSMSNGDVIVRNNDLVFTGMNVYSSTGVLLHSQELTDEITKIDLSYLRGGLYFIQGYNSKTSQSVSLFLAN